jgi:hypothetical protein
MIAPVPSTLRPQPAESWQAIFEAMLPQIRAQARYAFRHMRSEAREEAIAGVVCAACVAYARLVTQGRGHVACPSALTRYAIRQYRDGRRTGCQLNVKDVSSEHCQLKKHLTLRRLDRWDRMTGQWEEVLLEDRHAGPAATAAARIDVQAWLEMLRPRDRRMAEALALGARTREVARRFHLSEGRVSQKRSELRRHWLQFQGEHEGANS